MKLAAIILLPLALAGAALGSATWIVVDVKEGDGPRIVVPVPLFAVEVAASLVPEQRTRVSLPQEAARVLPAAARICRELREAPDGVLVEVEDRDETVLISKVEDDLQIKVRGPRETVDVTLPLDAVEEIIESFDGKTLQASDVLAALRRVSRTDLVRVEDGKDRVRVWIW